MKPILVALLILWVGLLSLTHSPVIHHQLADASHSGSIGGILVGLALCLPIVGFFVLVRMFSRWQRSLHQRMRTDGIAGRRSAVQP